MLTVLLALAAAAAPPDALLDALAAEATRTEAALGHHADTPLYYLSYRVRDGVSLDIAASNGALDASVPPAGSDGRSRILDVDARVGSPQLDSSHKIRGGRFDFDGPGFTLPTYLPIEDDPEALRLGIWQATDRAYKEAANRLIRVRANEEIKVSEKDRADDFTLATGAEALLPPAQLDVDRAAWAARVKRLSARFEAHPLILHSQVTLDAEAATDYFVDTQGARLREPSTFARVMISASVKADDGMELELYRDFEGASPAQLPPEAQLASAVDELAATLEALRKAPVIDPYTGPAIIENRAAGVFFHEIFGHRIEGHRQKDADEGHTFTHKVGQAVLPAFISVADDPTADHFGKTWLNGHYAYDDEGTRAQRAQLVANGILETFLLGRSPLYGFSQSNGHGRAQPGFAPVARQGNLIVSSTKQVPFAELRRMLIDEVKRQHKPYGLLFEDISGGFTQTRAGYLPQAFKVLPLVVKRVYPDGRPDELVRGVDLIGTPLTSFEKILATGDDYDVFNGFCGAESGFVPVSAVAPSLLVGEIEVERRRPEHDRPPLLPPPALAAPGATP